MSGPRLTLQIKVVKCIALKRVKVSPSKKADPYVILQVEDTVASTVVKEGTLDPIFNETFAFDVSHDFLDKEKGKVTVKVCHHDGGQGKLMGEFTLSFAKLVDGTNYLQLHAPKSKDLVGSLVLSVSKAVVVNQYIRDRADALSITKGSSSSSPGSKFDKPLLSYQKAALSKVPTTSKHINSLTPTKQGTTYTSPGDKKAPTKLTRKVYSTSPGKGKPGQSPAKASSRTAPPSKGKGGPLGFVGSLVKNSVKLGVMGAVAILGISFVPEDKLDNEVTRFAKRARAEAQEKLEVWGEVGAEKAKELTKQGLKAAGGGAKFVSEEYQKLTGDIFGKKYTIKRGDTLSKLASDNNTTTERLLKLNGKTVADKDFIVPGSIIKV